MCHRSSVKQGGLECAHPQMRDLVLAPAANLPEVLLGRHPKGSILVAPAPPESATAPHPRPFVREPTVTRVQFAGRPPLALGGGGNVRWQEHYLSGRNRIGHRIARIPQTSGAVCWRSIGMCVSWGKALVSSNRESPHTRALNLEHRRRSNIIRGLYRRQPRIVLRVHVFKICRRQPGWH